MEGKTLKVGLLSMHRVNNYGSFWQAYCLKKLIESITIEEDLNRVEFVDILPGEEETRTVYKNSFSFSKVKRIPYYIVFQRKKKRIFVNAQKAVLECFEEPNYSIDYDAIIIGSDEVFNFVQKSPWGFTAQLYGDIEHDNVNSYAACFGFTTLKDIENRGVYNQIANALSNMKHLSVRDQNSAEIIKHITGYMPMIHFDPVLVGELPFDKLNHDVKERYILIYSYDFRFVDTDIIKQVKKLSKEEDCKIYSVGFYQDWCDKNIAVNPIELLSYFKHALYVVTDTFHGTIFSVRLHKKFVTVIRNTNRQKLFDLLKRIDMLERIISNPNNVSSIIKTEIDYKAFEELRGQERLRTEEYLKGCLTQ